MGILGQAAGRFVGKKIGRFAGRKLGKYTGIGEERGGKFGGDVGGALGTLTPYKKGGPVKKTAPALLHKGEYVLPKGVKPTKKQKMLVEKRRRK
jgi:hypothetical protein